jgi:hypothetical protein
MKKYISALLAILAIAQASLEQQIAEMRLNIAEEPGKHHNKPERKQTRAGRGRPAKGYDPVTKTWNK